MPPYEKRMSGAGLLYKDRGNAMIFILFWLEEIRSYISFEGNVSD